MSTQPATPQIQSETVVATAEQAEPSVNQKNGRRPANATLERLFTLYPSLFGSRFRPLKLGVFQELLARHPERFSRAELKTALGLHARSTRYLEAVAAGEPRHDLEGQPVEAVAPEHVHHAIAEIYRRRQTRGRTDATVWLKQRLLGAIDACGLSREAYLARTRSTDPAVQQAVEEAFAQCDERNARAEALLRAFEASSNDVSAFAAMYGMEPSKARQELDRARQRREAVEAG